MKRLRTVELLLVQVGAVGGSEVLDHDDVALPRDAGMVRGGERIVEPDFDVSAAESSALAGNFIRAPGLVTGSMLHEQPRLEAVAIGLDEVARGRVHAGGVVRSGLIRAHYALTSAAQIAQRAPGHPHQE